MTEQGKAPAAREGPATRLFYRAFCWVFGHETYYSETVQDGQSGYLMAYEISCQTCGRVLDRWHSELFPPRDGVRP